MRASRSHGTRTANAWFNAADFSTPAAFTFGNVGRNTIYGTGMQTLGLALHRENYSQSATR